MCETNKLCADKIIVTNFKGNYVKQNQKLFGVFRWHFNLLEKG